ncbi:MAG: hypothetical protein ACLFSQ_07145 [Candidatus Zixiibacteriota bacterium]
MKQEILIREILKSTNDVIEEVIGIKPVQLETANYLDDRIDYEITVINSITGGKKGIFLIRCSRETADKINAIISKKYSDTERNPLCSLSNEITSEAKKSIIDMNLDFSESALIEGENLQFGFSSSSKVRAIELELEDIGIVSIVIVYKSK